MDGGAWQATVHSIAKSPTRLKQLSIRGSSRPWDQTHVSRVPYVGRWIPYHCATWEALCYLHCISSLRIQC